MESIKKEKCFEFLRKEIEDCLSQENFTESFTNWCENGDIFYNTDLTEKEKEYIEFLYHKIANDVDKLIISLCEIQNEIYANTRHNKNKIFLNFEIIEKIDIIENNIIVTLKEQYNFEKKKIYVDNKFRYYIENEENILVVNKYEQKRIQDFMNNL